MTSSKKFWQILGEICSEGLSWALVLLIAAYRTIGTSFLGGSCRFYPSCSHYAAEAAKTHSPVSAIRLISLRVLRCRPGVLGGFDPVPLREKR